MATLPGFEMQADGSSRLFVELTQSVAIEEKRGAGRVTYLLRGAHVAHTNNENALVTTFFNTPVDSARLIPAAGGLEFIIELRADAAPTWKLTPAKDSSAILDIEFPKGDYLARPSSPPAAQAAPPAANTGRTGKGRRSRPPPPPRPQGGQGSGGDEFSN